MNKIPVQDNELSVSRFVLIHDIIFICVLEGGVRKEKLRLVS